MKSLNLHFLNLCMLLGDGCNIRVTYNIYIVVFGVLIIGLLFLLKHDRMKHRKKNTTEYY